MLTLPSTSSSCERKVLYGAHEVLQRSPFPGCLCDLVARLLTFAACLSSFSPTAPHRSLGGVFGIVSQRIWLASIHTVEGPIRHAYRINLSKTFPGADDRSSAVQFHGQPGSAPG